MFSLLPGLSFHRDQGLVSLDATVCHSEKGSFSTPRFPCLLRIWDLRNDKLCGGGGGRGSSLHSLMRKLENQSHTFLLSYSFPSFGKLILGFIYFVLDP